MDTFLVKKRFKNEINNNIRIVKEDENRYKIFTPFHFDDGDCVVSVLKKIDNNWVISDEGNTYMRLSFRIVDNLAKETRKRIIKVILLKWNLKDKDGDLFVSIYNNSYGDALFNFLQGILELYNFIIFT